MSLRMWWSGQVAICVIALGLVTSAAAEPVFFIAGMAPSERPAGAPVIEAFSQTPEWRAEALFGVVEPVPPSLSWLDDQGAWFNPFLHPGMPAPYDLRGWHAAP